MRHSITEFFVLSFLTAGCKDKPAPERDLVAAVRGIIQVQNCAVQSAESATTRDYPHTLEAMGPRGTACLDSSALGASGGSVMRYFPGPADSEGHVQHYWVMSRDTSGYPGQPAYLGDEFGQVFEGRYDPRWDQTGPDSLAKLLWLRSPVPYLRYVFGCIKGTYEMYLGEYPEDLSHAEHREPPGCITLPDQNSAVFEVDQGNRAGSAKFVVEYHASEKDPRLGYPKSFSLRAWPVTYGDASIRSFFVDTAGAVHFTNENRRASSGDPLVFGCDAADVFSQCSVRVAESSGMTGGSQH